ncbi:MAG: HAD-IIA family hydrolase [Actinobacteria bacterium]|nr:HAD-IIA family hydrolase [Actinomycetota bacterium]
MTATANSPKVPGAVLCDLDGVVWLAHRPIAGAVAAIAALRSAGHRVLFVTNNSADTIEAQQAALAAIGVPAVGDVLTSAMAAGRLVEPGERVVVCGGEGIRQAMRQRGAVVVESSESAGAAGIDAVVVGFHRDFDYAGLTRAAAAVRGGARLIGTNDDATYPTPSGPIPGGGSILAAVQTAAGVAAVVAGKPYRPMVELVEAEIGPDAAKQAVMVGDRPSTDGRFARALGCAYAHVHSGVTPRGAALDPEANLTADDLAAVAQALLAGWGLG